MIFLMKMSNEYANVRSHILMMDNLPSLAQVYRMLLQEQRHKEISKPFIPNESIAFAAERNQSNFRTPNSQRFTNRTGTGVIGRGYSNNFNYGFQQRKVTYFCDHCKIPGHDKERCFKLNGYPPGFKLSQSRRFANLAANSTDNLDDNATRDNSSGTGIGTVTGSSSASPNISVDQYNQLMALLTPTNIEQDSSPYSGNALLAGNSVILN
ncbi:uncharacterized protein LOC141703260 isoform X2 [Apium graveolens]|uniref:uncharacterized protein LOC141703260 isoform X2 n=1 Tax=Apium graveolens TaxID=4045 RepID=UPI003D7C0344